MSTPKSSAPATPATPGTQSRWANRPKATVMAKVAMVLFAVGVVAIAADLVLFASGRRDLPLWLNLLCMLAPLGLGVGLWNVVREARRASHARQQKSAG